MLVGALFLWIALDHVDLARTTDALRHASAGWCVLAWVAGVAFMAAKAWRWECLLRPVEPFRFATVHRAVYAGTAANLVVPHSGEILRATLLGLRANRPASPILTTIGLERLFDFAMLALIATLGLLLDPEGSPLLVASGGIALGIAAVGAYIVWAYLHPTPRMRRGARWMLSKLPQGPRDWMERQLKRGVAGLVTLEDPRLMAKVLLQSAVQWGCIVVAIWASAKAVSVDLPASGAILIFVLTVIGLTLPSPPVQVGATQLAFVVGFEWYGASAEAGFAASVVYTVFVVLWMLGVGGLASALGRWASPTVDSGRGQPNP